MVSKSSQAASFIELTQDMRPPTPDDRPMTSDVDLLGTVDNVRARRGFIELERQRIQYDRP